MNSSGGLTQANRLRILRTFTFLSGTLVALLGAVVLAGWLFGIDQLVAFTGKITMKTNTALSLLLAGLSLLLLTPENANTSRRRIIGRLFAMAVTLIGLLTCSEHLFGWDLGIDQLLANEPPGSLGVMSPNRMGPPASLCFALSGIACILLSLGTRHETRAQWFAAAVCLIAFLPTIGYLYEAQYLYGLARYSGIAPVTAVALLILGFGMLCARPLSGFIALLTADDPGGIIVRNLLLPALLLPLVLGFLQLLGVRYGLFDAALGTALLMLCLIVTVLSLLWRNGSRLSAATAAERAMQDQLRQARDELARANADLEKTVARRTARLRDTIAELEHFSYAIVHDMRAPLRAMQGFAAIIEEECASQGSEAQEYCRRIQLAANRMDQLITDSLSYSKIARQSLVLEPVPLTSLLQGIVDTYPNLHPDKAAIHMAPDLPVVRGNVAALTQCFSNLLGNAVKFAKPNLKPHIRVWAEKRPSSNNTTPSTPNHSVAINHVVRIWIEDNGVGIPLDFQQRIFGMFERASNKYEGTGMGLAIVRKVAERMGGKVGFESQPDHGSRFWVELPPAALPESTRPSS